MVAIKDLGWPRLVPIKPSASHPSPRSHSISRSISTQNVKETSKARIIRRPTRRVSEGDSPIPESQLVPLESDLILGHDSTAPMAPVVSPASPARIVPGIQFGLPPSNLKEENDAQDNSTELTTKFPHQEAFKAATLSIPKRPPLQRMHSESTFPTSNSAQPMQALEPRPFSEAHEEERLASLSPGSKHSSSIGSVLSSVERKQTIFSTDSILELIQFIPDTPIGGTPSRLGALTPTGAYPTPALTFTTAPVSPRISIMNSAYDGPATPLSTTSLPGPKVSSFPPTQVDMPSIKKRDFAHPLSECNTPSTVALPEIDFINQLPFQAEENSAGGLSKWTGTLPLDEVLTSIPTNAGILGQSPVGFATGAVPLNHITTSTQGISRALPLNNLPADAVIGVVPLDATGVLPAPITPLPSASKKMKAKKKVGNVTKVGRRVVLRKPILSLVLGRQLAGPTAFLLKQISRGGPLPDAIGMIGTVSDAIPGPISGGLTGVAGAVPSAATSSLPF